MSNQPWPAAPLGRVIIPLYGLRVVLPTCEACLTGFRFRDEDGMTTVTLGEALLEPSRLRSLVQRSQGLIVHVANSVDRPRLPTDFLAIFEEQALPLHPRLQIGISSADHLETWPTARTRRDAVPSIVVSPAYRRPESFLVMVGPGQIIRPARFEDAGEIDVVTSGRYWALSGSSVAEHNGIPPTIACQHELSGCYTQKPIRVSPWVFTTELNFEPSWMINPSTDDDVFKARLRSAVRLAIFGTGLSLRN